MKNANLAKNIAALRKRVGLTQEQLAASLNVTPQAVSKWENNVCQPDAAMLPAIAERFGVSIDYLFYGETLVYDDLFEAVTQKVKSHPQMSREQFEEAFAVFTAAHKAFFFANAYCPGSTVHISNENGVAVWSDNAFGAVVTREYFRSVDRGTAEFSARVFELLADTNRLWVVLAILSMSDISFGELKEKLGFSDEELSAALAPLIETKLVVEVVSKHKSLGTTYTICDMYHSGICLLLSTMEMQKRSLENGISCHMGFGDYPIDLQ